MLKVTEKQQEVLDEYKRLEVELGRKPQITDFSEDKWPYSSLYLRLEGLKRKKIIPR